MQPVTIKTIAEKLGLSIATVSRALKDSHEISVPTRERVKQAALELGYQPNANASGLRAGSSKTIAVMVPEVENHFFSQVISGIESVARANAYHVLIYLTHEDHEKEEEFVQLLRNGRADGLLISVTHNPNGYAYLNRLTEIAFPLVLFDRLVEEVDVPVVATNNETASYEACNLLFQRGATRPAFLGLDADLYITKTRMAGYLRALRENRPDPQPLIFTGTGQAEYDRQALEKFLDEHRPDALFGAAESMALLLYEVCRRKGYRIPDDYQLISFTNLGAVPFLNPSLTSVVQPAFEIGRAAAELLFKVIKKKKIYAAEQKQILPSVIRMAESLKG